MTSGGWAYVIQDLHNTYGDVVRIAPNELSIATAKAYEDIYGHAKQGRRPFLKSSTYDIEGPSDVVRTRDPVDHRTQRQALSAAFSAKALRTQEDIIHQYVDMFISQLERRAGPDTAGLNIVEALNWVTFDIIGDLAFGESFDAVKNGKTHPWVSLIVEMPYMARLISMRKRLPALNLILPFLVHRDLSKDFAYHKQMTADKVKNRVEKKDSPREDFFKQILSKSEWDMPKLAVNGEVLIIAGSETTATTLSGLAYHLSKTPCVLGKLQQEIRGAFRSYDEITGDTTARLPYLHAVIEEGLRIFTPVPSGLSRISPGAMVAGHWIPAGAVVEAQNWTILHDERYFHDPDTFIPERWMEDGADIRKEAFRPFSLGPRVCLGINLAYLELRVILAKLVFSFEWELVDAHVDWTKENKLYGLWKKAELKMRFHPSSK